MERVQDCDTSGLALDSSASEPPQAPIAMATASAAMTVGRIRDGPLGEHNARMDADEIIARLRRGYEAFNRGELDSVAAELAPEVTVEERPESPDPENVLGRDRALAAIGSLRDEFDDYRFEERQILVEGEHVIAVMRQSAIGKLSRVPVDGDIVHAWHVQDDRVVALRAFSTLEEAREAIRSGADEPART